MPVTTTVSDLMTTDVVSVHEDQDVVFASGAMTLRRIRHLPVLKDGKLVGMLSHRDLIRAQAKLFDQLSSNPGQETRIASVSAKEIMTRDVRTVPHDMAADQAAMLLVDHKIGALPVLNGDTLVGIVTEADFLVYAVGVLASANAGAER